VDLDKQRTGAASAHDKDVHYLRGYDDQHLVLPFNTQIHSEATFSRSFNPGGETEYFFHLGIREQKEVYYERGHPPAEHRWHQVAARAGGWRATAATPSAGVGVERARVRAGARRARHADR
jgi:hypothetical protein